MPAFRRAKAQPRTRRPSAPSLFDKSPRAQYNATMPDTNALLRSLPAMDELLDSPWAAGFSAAVGRELVRKAAADALDGIRAEILGGMHAECAGGAETLFRGMAESRASDSLSRKSSSTLRRVVNASGVVIHTNLGRAPLSRGAIKAVSDAAGTYSTLEYSPENGARAGRVGHVEWLICHLTGAQAALVVNNNAAAVLLALSATSAGREVIVSCGELVEIGDSFRIPDILAFSGAKMVAVGCTNSTRISDYEAAVTENTAALLKVHPSNYSVEGFVSSAGRREIARLAESRGLAFIEDLGSGLLIPPALPFARREPSARECLAEGVGAVTFSGDKLLGGPQIGVAAGSREIIDRMRKHQLLRALRVDKMTLAAFEATLRAYASGRHGEIPVVRMMEAGREGLRKRAERICRELRRIARGAGGGFEVSVAETEDAIGGGSFPSDRLAGFGAAIRSRSIGAEGIARAFRNSSPPVIAAIRDGRVVIHARTLLDGDERAIASAFAEIAKGAR